MDYEPQNKDTENCPQQHEEPESGQHFQPPVVRRSALPGAMRRQTGVFSTFSEDYGPMEKGVTTLGVVDALLKRPARVTHEIVKGNLPRAAAALFVIIALCMLGYGVLMGSFSGGHQLWVVPLKALVGILLSALICLPSLYIFACLSGSSQTLPQTGALLLVALALGGILLAGFAPIVWVFSQSTNGIAFMGFLHIAFWLVATHFSLRLLSTAFGFLNERGTAFVKAWGVVFIIVVMQMSTLLRPLVGEFQGYKFQGKQFFLAHWMESMK